MASSLFYSPGEVLSQPVVNDNSPQPTYDEADPSNDISATTAAHILATLSDSRPQTSHGEDANAQEMDQDSAGGVTLTSEDHAVSTGYQPVMASHDGPEVDLESADTAVAPVNLTNWLMNAEATLHDALDQHAAAFESLSVTQSTASSMSSAMADQLLAFQAPSWTALHDYESDAGFFTNDDFFHGIEHKDKFWEVSAFFNKFVLGKNVTLPLDGENRPRTITRDDLNGDAFDMQGINWSLRNTTKAAVRSKRVAFECARQPTRLRTARKVCHVGMLSCLKLIINRISIP